MIVLLSQADSLLVHLAEYYQLLFQGRIGSCMLQRMYVLRIQSIHLPVQTEHTHIPKLRNYFSFFHYLLLISAVFLALHVLRILIIVIIDVVACS